MDSNGFLKLGSTYTGCTLTASRHIAMRRFRSFFGITPYVCCITWNKIQRHAPSGAEPKHLLWCLSFLKQYAVEHYRRVLFGADEKTIRKWTWIFVQLLADLDVITWESRFDGAVNGQTSFTSLDGVDFPIVEPRPFSRAWYSHKFHGPGLRYEVALNIRTGFIVWVHGGVPCGLFPDLKLARESFVVMLNRGERVIADKGYSYASHFILSNAHNTELHSIIMSRHETVNRRLKQFRILKQEFRHALVKHPMVVHTVANITQLMLQNGHPLFTAI